MNRLDEIAARADAASTGPWAIDLDDYDGASVYIDDGDTWGRAYVCTDLQQDEYEGKNDAEFIAHAREDVPKLVAALRAVEAVCAAWTARGEHDMAYSKTIPDENIADVLLTDGADMVERARIISNTIREALGS